MRRRDRLMEWAAGLLLPVLIALTGVLSYSALRALALGHGYQPWEAALWPLSVDAFALVVMLTAMVSARRTYGPSLEAWGLTLVSIGATVAGNVLSAGQDPVAQVMHAWPAAALMGAWHVWTRYVSARPRPWADTGPDTPDSVLPVLSAPGQGRTLPSGQVALQEYRAALEELGPGASTADVARGLGVSERTVRRLRERERGQSRPRVVGADRVTDRSQWR